jgi:hypothetical protein
MSLETAIQNLADAINNLANRSTSADAPKPSASAKATTSAKSESPAASAAPAESVAAPKAGAVAAGDSSELMITARRAGTQLAAKDKSKLTGLLAKYGASKFSELPADKLKLFADEAALLAVG